MTWIDLRHPPLTPSQRVAQRIVELDKKLLDLMRTRQRVSITNEPPFEESAAGSIHADVTHGALSVKAATWLNVGTQRDTYIEDDEEDQSTSTDTTTYNEHGEGWTVPVPATGVVQFGITFEFQAPLGSELGDVAVMVSGFPLHSWAVGFDSVGLWTELGASQHQRRPGFLPPGSVDIVLGLRHQDVGSTIKTRNRKLYTLTV